MVLAYYFLNLMSYILECVQDFNLWYNYISQGAGQPEQLQCVLKPQRCVVLRVIFDAVIDIGDLADVVTPILHAEITL